MLNRSSGVEFNGRSWRRAATLSWAIGLLCLLANSAFAQFNIQYDGKWVGQLQCAGVVKEVRANIRRSDFVMLHFMEGGLEILRGEVSDKGIVELIGKPDDAHAGEWKAKFTGKFQGDFFTAIGRFKGPRIDRQCIISMRWASSL